MKVTYTKEEKEVIELYQNKVFYGLEVPICSLDADDLTWAKAIWDRNPCLHEVFDTPHRWILNYGFIEAFIRQIISPQNMSKFPKLSAFTTQRFVKLCTLELWGIIVLQNKYQNNHKIPGGLQEIFILHDKDFKLVHTDCNKMTSLMYKCELYDGVVTLPKNKNHPELSHDGSHYLDCTDREEFIAKYDPEGIQMVRLFKAETGESFWPFYGATWAVAAYLYRNNIMETFIKTLR